MADGWVIVGTIAGVVSAVAAVAVLWPHDEGKGTTQTTINYPPSVGVPTDAARPPAIVTVPPDSNSGGNPSSGGYEGGRGNTDNSTAPAPSQPAITRVDVSSRRGNGAITDLGPGRFKLPNYVHVIPPPQMTFDWSSQGPSGEVSGQCRVDIRIDGPTAATGYPKSQQDGSCSGSADDRIAVYDPGDYTVYVTVSPPDGGEAITGQTTFTLVS